MLMILLPVAIALSLLFGIAIDPLRTLGAVLIGARDGPDGVTLKACLLWSLVCTLLYLAIRGFAFDSVVQFVAWSALFGPVFTCYVGIAVLWTRRAPKAVGGSRDD